MIEEKEPYEVMQTKVDGYNVPSCRIGTKPPLYTQHIIARDA